MLVLSAGVAGNRLRFLAPLVITDEQLEEALDVLERCVEEVAATRETSPLGLWPTRSSPGVWGRSGTRPSVSCSSVVALLCRQPVMACPGCAGLY